MGKTNTAAAKTMTTEQAEWRAMFAQAAKPALSNGQICADAAEWAQARAREANGVRRREGQAAFVRYCAGSTGLQPHDVLECASDDATMTQEGRALWLAAYSAELRSEVVRRKWCRRTAAKILAGTLAA